jgi:hypothetical protein
MPAQMQALAQNVVHNRLDHIEEGIDALHFLSLFASALFFNLGPFQLLKIPTVLEFYGPQAEPIARIAVTFGLALLCLGIVRFVYRIRTRFLVTTVTLLMLAITVGQYAVGIQKFHLTVSATVSSCWKLQAFRPLSSTSTIS